MKQQGDKQVNELDFYERMQIDRICRDKKEDAIADDSSDMSGEFTRE